ncbi:hypothetical protein GAMM_220013 [Gammaproteobacteria bacterium]
MNKEKLFNYLKYQKPSELIELLNACCCRIKIAEKISPNNNSKH